VLSKRLDESRWDVVAILPACRPIAASANSWRRVDADHAQLAQVGEEPEYERRVEDFACDVGFGQLERSQRTYRCSLLLEFDDGASLKMYSLESGGSRNIDTSDAARLDLLPFEA
jgi:hypothetical protein